MIFNRIFRSLIVSLILCSKVLVLILPDIQMYILLLSVFISIYFIFSLPYIDVFIYSYYNNYKYH